MEDSKVAIVSIPDETSLGSSSQTTDTLAVEQVTTPPADLVKQTKEVEVRGGRAIVLNHRQQPLAACEVELLNAPLALLAEKRWGAGPIQYGWTVVQAHEHEGQSPSSSIHYDHGNLAMSVNS